MGMNLIMTTVAATAVASGCSWAHPGANPYRGDPPAALADFAMPEETRRKLRALMARAPLHRRRDDHARRHRRPDDATTTCARCTAATASGATARRSFGLEPRRTRNAASSTASATTCVIVPTVCNNVSLVTRKPDDAPLLGAPTSRSTSAPRPARRPRRRTPSWHRRRTAGRWTSCRRPATAPARPPAAAAAIGVPGRRRFRRSAAAAAAPPWRRRGPAARCRRAAALLRQPVGPPGRARRR